MSHVQLKNIKKAYGSHVALKDVSLSIDRGAFFTLLGPSGCGKTTLLRAIAGFHQQDAGEILLDPRLYMAGPADILSLLRTVGEKAETVMIVGHNPGLEELVAQLTGDWQDLPTAALAQIVLPIDQWRDLKLSTRGTLVGHWRPKELA